MLYSAPRGLITPTTKTKKGSGVKKAKKAARAGTAEDYTSVQTLDDILEKAGMRTGSLKSKGSLSETVNSIGGRYASQLGGFGSELTPIAMKNFAEILLNKGQTDPRSMNFQLSDISQGTLGAQDALSGQLAELGLGRSGAGIATGASIGQAGADRRARLMADEARLAEDRKRSDLSGLYTTLISDPTLAYHGVGQDLAAKQQGRKDVRNQANTQTAATILAALAMAACWVAAEVFDGWGDPRTHQARRYILTAAPVAFRDAYLRHGRELAAWLRINPWAKPLVRPAFLRFAALGRELG